MDYHPNSYSRNSEVEIISVICPMGKKVSHIILPLKMSLLTKR